MKKNKVQFLTQSAIIAAMYAVLTIVAMMMNLAFGSVQFRFSEALTILPVFTPAAIPGLSIGCFIANLSSPFGMVDWIFGTLASLLSALLTYYFRNIKIKGLPILSFLAPVILNALIIGFEITCISADGIFNVANFSLPIFYSIALSVGIGQLAMCVGLGVPLYLLMKKTKIMKLI